MKRLILCMMSGYCVFCGRTEPVGPLPDITRAVASGASELFAFQPEDYRTLQSGMPVGIFDSGIGGLTVLSAILQCDGFDNATGTAGADGRPDFERERFVYLGDQANMPYGNYASEQKTDFLRELVIKDAVFLLGRRYWPSARAGAPRFDKPPVKAMVIACNTATAYGLNDVRRSMELWNLPVRVTGVVGAGAEGAMEFLDGAETVAIMATIGTCQSEGYVRAVGESARLRGRPAPRVIQQGSLGLAGAVEGDAAFIDPDGTKDTPYRGPFTGHASAPLDTSMLDRYGFDPAGLLGLEEGPGGIRLNSVENYIRYDVFTLVEQYRRSGAVQPIGAVVLGCTHFPFYTERFRSAFKRLRTLETAQGEHPFAALIAEDLQFVDPAVLTASELYTSLRDAGLILKPGQTATAETDAFFISVPNPDNTEAELEPDGGFTHAYKYDRSPGKLDIEYVRRVPMTPEVLGPETVTMIQNTLPVVWKRMARFQSAGLNFE